ncbi:MAG: transcriptional repressor [Acidimicrobiia bacterium]|nr:transcriptional repressor [Acidimicrobiia bacterium]
MSNDDLRGCLRAGGRRVTPQRAVIADAICEAPGHATAEMVYSIAAEHLPGLSLKTVYQTLHELVTLGALVRLDVGTGSARFDLRTDAHHHVVCDRCGLVDDVMLDITALRLPADMAERFEVDRTDVVVRGRCTHHGDGSVNPA